MAPERTTDKIARCSIYEERPQVCRVYPKVDHYLPEECTYTFVGSDREGDCSCDVGACCRMPREGGEPGGTPLPFIAGGLSCKHLVWEDKPKSKEAGESAEEPLVVHSGSIDLYELIGGSSDS
jgi:hypothetical protein